MSKSQIVGEKKIKSNVIYASIITSKARVKLYESCISTIEAGGRILYIDTDCIYAAFTKDLNFTIPNTRANEEKILDAVFVAPKTYAIKFASHTEIKTKGVDNNSLNFEDFKKKIL